MFRTKCVWGLTSFSMSSIRRRFRALEFPLLKQLEGERLYTTVQRTQVCRSHECNQIPPWLIIASSHIRFCSSLLSDISGKKALHSETLRIKKCQPVCSSEVRCLHTLMMATTWRVKIIRVTHALTYTRQVFWLLGANQASADNVRHHFAFLSVWTQQIKTTKYYALKQLTNVDIKFCAVLRRIGCQQESLTLSALWDDFFPPLQKLTPSPNIRTKCCSACQFQDFTENRYWSFHIIYH